MTSQQPKSNANPNPATSDSASVALTPLGSTAFDVADRLAIINLINSYGYFIDEYGTDRFDELFAEAPTIEIHSGGKILAKGLTQFSALVHARHANFERENIQRRHILSAPRFDSQDSISACGQVYLQYYETRRGKSPALISVGLYEFRAIKRDSQWKLGSWIARPD